MILFDGVHMASDVSLEELKQEALKLGLKEKWLHESKIPHYDILGKYKKKIEKNCSARDIVLRCRDLYKKG